MSMRFAVAFIGSLLAHGGLATLALALVAPRPVPQQAVPDSTLNLSAMQVPQSDARPSPAESQHLNAEQPSANAAPSLSSGNAAISSRAQAKPLPTAARLKGAAPTGARLGTVNQAATVQIALSMDRAPQQAVSTKGALTSAISPKSSPLAAVTQAPKPHTTSELPVLELASTTPGVKTVPLSPPPSTNVVAQSPKAPRIAAAFDWTGAPSFDAASLDTVAAFLRPETSAGQNMRDTLTATLKAPKCSRVQTTFDPQSSALALQGHLRDESQRAPLLAALSDQLGDSLPLHDQLLILPAPQCTILASLDQLDLPQSEEQFTDPMLVGDAAQARTYDFVAGERLIIDLEAPDYPAFVYLDYFDANGDVIHLVPSAPRPLEAYAPAELFSVGRTDPETGTPPALALEIAPPFGQDIAVAYAASHPLYDGLRPFVEPATPYLAFLQDRISLARTANKDFRGEWAYLFVITREKQN